MPNYEDAAKKFGWEKVGSKWVNKAHPDKTYYNAREIYRDMIPESHKRPDSITPRRPEPPKVEPAAAVLDPDGNPPSMDAPPGAVTMPKRSYVRKGSEPNDGRP